MRRAMVVLALALPVLILLFSFKMYVFNVDFYKSEFAKHDTYEQFPEADSALANLIGYMQAGVDLDSDTYTEREILHMRDVKRIVWGCIYALDMIFIAALILLIIMLARHDYSAISASLLASGAVSFVIALLAVTFSMLSFADLFALFHQMAFTNDLWLLPPESALIRMFPEQFFYDIVKAMLINSMYLSMFLAAVGLGARYVAKE
ncbi:MAG: DUF1461 domain-containing protein [Nanoarchaeota archaeon]